MKRFLIRLVIFFFIMLACDIAVGFVGSKLVKITSGGAIGRMNYTANRAKEDVLVFGSSRAIHHYDPDILEDAFNMTAYNCGFDGNGIICAYGFFRNIKSRYYPQILIYDIASGFDLKIGDNHKYLGHLRYFYDNDGIDSLFWDVDKIERYKMLSQMYRYNSVVPQLIMNNLHPFKNYHKGYLPLDTEMGNNIKPLEKQTDLEYDSLKLHYIERLIEDCKGKILLVFAVSPMYENTDDEVLAPIKVLCEAYGVPLLNHYTDSSFNYTREYFSDRTHLNRTGATEYSKVVAAEIKQLLEHQYP